MNLAASELNYSFKCHECDMALESPAEYHPRGFCILFAEGIHPGEFIREAIAKTHLYIGPTCPDCGHELETGEDGRPECGECE